MNSQFASLGLASHIFQFVDFAATLVTSSAEIYRSVNGSTVAHADLRNSLKTLQYLSAPLRSQGQSPNQSLSHHHNYHVRGNSFPDKAEQHIADTAVACGEIAVDLAEALDELVARPKSLHSSLFAALRTLWGQEKVEAVVKRLEVHKGDLQLLMIQSLRDRQSFIQLSIDNLRTDNENLGMKSDEVLMRLQGIKDELQEVHRSQGGLLSRRTVFVSDTMRDGLRDLYDQGQEVLKAADILRSLQFDRMTVRRQNVVDRHVTTLEWMYDEEHEGRRLCFKDWLQSGSGIYWITGNAGSGKSTLIKFIYQDPRTRKHLQDWATEDDGSSTLIMADFFFWKPGDELERSQIGLLRSLLFEVLRQLPEALPEVLASRWRDGLHNNQPWTLAELQTAIRSIGSLQGTKRSIKLCFFIDGLDEYQGYSHEIAQVVKDLSQSPNIKLCVASRPWNTFEAAFGSDQDALLRIHEHNGGDIRQYVDQILGQNPIFQQLVSEDQRYQRVLQKIVEKAKGVFLWVFLVVRNLRETLPNEDPWDMLEQMIDDFPSELEAYFDRMIGGIAERYHLPSSTLFLNVLDSKRLLPLVLVAHMASSSEAEEEDAHARLDGKLNVHIHTSRKLRARLHAYCGDLLTVVNWRTVPISEDSTVPEFEDCIERIELLHRTVSDYLEAPSVQARLRERVPASFNPSLSIFTTSARYLRMIYSGTPPGTLHIDHPVVTLLLAMAAQLESDSVMYPTNSLEQVRGYVARDAASNREFIHRILQRGLTSFIKSYFANESVSHVELDSTYAFSYSLFQPWEIPHRRVPLPPERQLDMLRVLLEYGADTNAIFPPDLPRRSKSTSLYLADRSIWVNYVLMAVDVGRLHDPSALAKRRTNRYLKLDIACVDLPEIYDERFNLLLQYGADYNAPLVSDGTVRDVFRSCYREYPENLENFDRSAREGQRRRRMASQGDEEQPGEDDSAYTPSKQGTSSSRWSRLSLTESQSSGSGREKILGRLRSWRK